MLTNVQFRVDKKDKKEFQKRLEEAGIEGIANGLRMLMKAFNKGEISLGVKKRPNDPVEDKSFYTWLDDHMPLAIKDAEEGRYIEQTLEEHLKDLDDYQKS